MAFFMTHHGVANDKHGDVGELSFNRGDMAFDILRVGVDCVCERKKKKTKIRKSRRKN